MSDAQLLELLDRAEQARAKAYAPYSGFHVGAALRGKSGAIYSGCNVENASYGATVCAERNAIAAMVLAGERELVAVAISCDGPEPAAPCGICRQVLAEFAEDAAVLMRAPGKEQEARLSELLPLRFELAR